MRISSADLFVSSIEKSNPILNLETVPLHSPKVLRTFVPKTCISKFAGPISVKLITFNALVQRETKDN